MKIKQVLFSSLILGNFLTTAFAYVPFDRFALEGALTYTKPSNNGLSVGDLEFANSGILNIFDGGFQHVFLDPDNEFDYALGLTYHLLNSDTRFFIYYDHYVINEEQGNINIRNLGMDPFFQDTVGFAGVRESAYEFSIGIIHDIHFDRLCLQLHGFLENDKVAQTLEETLNQARVPIGEEFFSGTHRARTTENVMHGFGPGIGMFARVYPFRCYPQWDFFAGAKTTLLYANHGYSQALIGSTPTLNDNFYLYEPEKTVSLVGKLDIQFGINYHYAFKYDMNGMQWDLTLGMRYMNMFNALKNGNAAYNPHADDDNEMFPNFPANLGYSQDWGRWGPFLKFKMGGAHS
ncbi:MAG: hypothetical protein JSS07_07875 [Proteobacteria bacterium]|nr:hypothetical protein [Pseudomonadota bacterium]